MRTYDARTPENRARIREHLAAHPASRSPVSSVNIAAILDLHPDELEALASGVVVDGYIPESVAAKVRARFGLPEPAPGEPPEPLGRELWRIDVLTEDEARWLDDVD